MHFGYVLLYYVSESEYIAKAGWSFTKKIESNLVIFNLYFLFQIFQDLYFINFNNVGKISWFQVSIDSY